MKRLLVAGLAIAPLLAATLAIAQQSMHPQETAKAKQLQQAPGGDQTSVPQQVSPATPTQATTSSDQPPLAKQSNEVGKARIEKEGK
jgi:hypothetical protein